MYIIINLLLIYYKNNKSLTVNIRVHYTYNILMLNSFFKVDNKYFYDNSQIKKFTLLSHRQTIAHRLFSNNNYYKMRKKEYV